MPSTTPEAKLERQLRVIAGIEHPEIFEKLNRVDLMESENDNSYSFHTALKLSYLNYYFGIALPVARSNFKRKVFVDTFGGTGITKLLHNKDRVSNYKLIGSTLLAALAEKTGHYDEVIAIESDPRRAELLENRCRALNLGKVVVIRADANKAVPTLAEKFNITQGTFVTLFVDPEGMQPNLASYLPLSHSTNYMDIILNYTFAVKRMAGRAEKGGREGDIRKLMSMLPNYSLGDDPVKSLESLFENEFGKSVGNEFDIHDNGRHVAYSMVLRTRRTTTDSKWDPLAKFGEILSTFDNKTTLNHLRIVHQDQRTLSV